MPSSWALWHEGLSPVTEITHWRCWSEDSILGDTRRFIISLASPPSPRLIWSKHFCHSPIEFWCNLIPLRSIYIIFLRQDIFYQTSLDDGHDCQERIFISTNQILIKLLERQMSPHPIQYNFIMNHCRIATLTYLRQNKKQYTVLIWKIPRNNVDTSSWFSVGEAFIDVTDDVISGRGDITDHVRDHVFCSKYWCM